MTEVRQTDATAEAENSTGETVETSGAQTVEEVEAYWRKRASGQALAHNAETASLKAQMEAMRSQSPAASVGENPEGERVKALEAELQRERQRASVAEFRSQYPLTSEVLGESIVNNPVEKIAAMEAALDAGMGGVAPRIDPNAARRPTGIPGQASEKPLNEKTKDELLADLRRVAPMIRNEPGSF